jgi:hypothetical protein
MCFSVFRNSLEDRLSYLFQTVLNMYIAYAIQNYVRVHIPCFSVNLYFDWFLSFIQCFVNYKKGCTRLAAASDKVYQLLVGGSLQVLLPVSSTTKTGRHNIAEILLKKNQSINIVNLVRQ